MKSISLLLNAFFLIFFMSAVACVGSGDKADNTPSVVFVDSDDSGKPDLSGTSSGGSVNSANNLADQIAALEKEMAVLTEKKQELIAAGYDSDSPEMKELQLELDKLNAELKELQAKDSGVGQTGDKNDKIAELEQEFETLQAELEILEMRGLELE